MDEEIKFISIVFDTNKANEYLSQNHIRIIEQFVIKFNEYSGGMTTAEVCELWTTAWESQALDLYDIEDTLMIHNLIKIIIERDNGIEEELENALCAMC